MRFFAICLLILSSCLAAQGQTQITASQCEPFDNAPKACQAILAPFGNVTQVWTAPLFGLTQEYFNALMWSFLDLPPTLPLRCAQLFLRLICPTFLQPCTDPAFTGPQAIPHPPCRSVCEEYNDQCGVFREVSCNAVNPLTGGPQWPNYTSPADPFACSLLPLDTLDEPEFPCPAGLHFLPSGDPKTPNQQVCAMTCADFITVNVGYRTSMNNDIWVCQSVLSTISLFCIIFTLITMITFPSTRAWPRRIVIFIGIGMLFEMIALFGDMTFGSAENLFCDDSTYKSSFAFEPSTWCEFSAWSLYFGGLIVVWWWSTQAFVLFWNVALMKDPKQLEKAEPVFHVINWLYPLITSFILLGLDKFGSLPGYPYCFLNTDTSSNLYWGIFAWVLCFGLLLVTVFLTLVMVRLSRESTLKSTFWSRWKYQIQLGIFAISFALVVTYIIALRAWVEDNLTDLQDNFTSIYRCLLSGFGPQVCETSLKINLYLLWSSIILISIQGILLFIIFFVLNEFNRSLWPLAWRNYREGRDVFYLPGSGAATSSASGASSASSTDDDAGAQRRSNRAFRRKLAADAPTV